MDTSTLLSPAIPHSGAALSSASREDRMAALANRMTGGAIQSKDKARAAAEEFEAQFLSTVFETLYQGIKTDGPFGGGQGEAMFRSLLIQEHTKAMTSQGGIGLADQIMTELQRYQEI